MPDTNAEKALAAAMDTLHIACATVRSQIIENAALWALVADNCVADCSYRCDTFRDCAGSPDICPRVQAAMKAGAR
jgi:hypothetical protein